MDQKTSFSKCFPFGLKNLKQVLQFENSIFQTGNGIIQTGNGILQTGNGDYFSNFKTSDKKNLVYKKCFPFDLRIPNPV